MKANMLMWVMLLFTLDAWAQDKTVMLSGGYAFTTIEDVDADASGWRINASYEIHPNAGKIMHGFTVGYNKVYTEIEEISGSETIISKYKIGTLPFYYSPRFLIGEGRLQGFIKGALGMQFSSLKRTGTLDDYTTNDAGLYAGLGAGIIKSFNVRNFITLEYEWAHASNSYYNDGFMHSIMLGIGFAVD